MITPLILETIPYTGRGVDAYIIINEYFLFALTCAIILTFIITRIGYKIEIKNMHISWKFIFATIMWGILILMLLFMGVPYTDGEIEKDKLEHVDITSLGSNQVSMNFHNIEDFDRVSMTTKNGYLLSSRTVNKGELRGNLLFNPELNNIRLVVLENGKIVEEQTLRLDIRTEYINIIDVIKMLF